MSMNDSERRLENSRIVPNAYRFNAAAAHTIAERITRQGKNVAGLSVHLGLKEDGVAEAWLVLQLDTETAADAGDCDPVNVSHPCPPFTDC